MSVLLILAGRWAQTEARGEGSLKRGLAEERGDLLIHVEKVPSEDAKGEIIRISYFDEFPKHVSRRELGDTSWPCRVGHNIDACERGRWEVLKIIW